MTKARWIIFAAVCVLLLGFLVVNSKENDIDVSTIDQNAVIASGVATDNVFGNKNAKVVVIEYGDFQCPGCAGAFPNIKEIKQTYKDKIAFVFRHFPLTTIHPNALAASTSAEAAGKQGKFWEMHDKLYENQDAWENVSASQRGELFAEYARQIGLNVDTFKTDLSSKAVADKITADRALGARAKVSSTPTVIVNGETMSSEVITNLVQVDGKQITDKIDAALKEAGETLPTKTQ